MSKTKNDRRILYTKMILRESLIELMKVKPVAKITPTELCRKAEMNRSTFYAYYDSPEELLQSVEEELYDKIKHSIERSLKKGSIFTLLTEICQAIYDSRDLCAVLFSQFGDKEFLNHIIDLAHDRSIAEWKAAGIREGEDIEMLYCFYVNGGVAVVRQWILEGMKRSPQEVAQLIERVTNRGLSGFVG